MNYAVIFSSQSGNTEQIASAIKNSLSDALCVYFGHPDGTIPMADILFIGSWVDKGTFHEPILNILKELHHKKIALFGTAGFGRSTDYFDAVLNRVQAVIPNDNTILDRFMCQGKMPQSVRQRYEKMLEQNPGDEKISSSISNFDQALTHPDKDDILHAMEFAHQVMSQK